VGLFRYIISLDRAEENEADKLQREGIDAYQACRPKKKILSRCHLRTQYIGMSASITDVGGISNPSDARDTCAVRCESAAVNDRQLIDALRRSKLYRNYKRVFMDATGLPLALRPVEFLGLPLHGNKNENPFCAFLAEREHRCTLCLQTQARLTASGGQMPRSIQCRYGLTETVVPIVLATASSVFFALGRCSRSTGNRKRLKRKYAFVSRRRTCRRKRSSFGSKRE